MNDIPALHPDLPAPPPVPCEACGKSFPIEELDGTLCAGCLDAPLPDHVRQKRAADKLARPLPGLTGKVSQQEIARLHAAQHYDSQADQLASEGKFGEAWLTLRAMAGQMRGVPIQPEEIVQELVKAGVVPA